MDAHGSTSEYKVVSIPPQHHPGLLLRPDGACANSIKHNKERNDMWSATRVSPWTPAMEYHLLQYPEGRSSTGHKYHLLCWQYLGGDGRGWYSHFPAGELSPWGDDPLDQVSQTEPSNYEDRSGAVYTSALFQSPPPSKEEHIRLCTTLKYRVFQKFRKWDFSCSVATLMKVWKYLRNGWPSKLEMSVVEMCQKIFLLPSFL